VVVCRGFRVESNPTLYGLLNEDIDIFMVLNFRNKSCVLVPFSYLVVHAFFSLFVA
jgi:hypothetical protein